MTDPEVEVAGVARRAVDPSESARASRVWWDAAADDYQAEHGSFLNGRFVWGPEGLDEEHEQLLGTLPALRDAQLLEVGCGAAWCARWLRQQGVERVVGIDVSIRQLNHARGMDAEGGLRTRLAQADAQRLPFPDGTFDVVFSAYGGFPFVPHADAAVAESARVLRPGGRLVFSVSHPIRWCFPDDPTERGLLAEQSYFDRRAYVEEDGQGRAVYVEHHHTVGDWVRAVASAGLCLRDLIEPEWPEDNQRVWGGWSPLRGQILPGTMIVVAEKPDLVMTGEESL